MFRGGKVSRFSRMAMQSRNFYAGYWRSSTLNVLTQHRETFPPYTIMYVMCETFPPRNIPVYGITIVCGHLRLRRYLMFVSVTLTLSLILVILLHRYYWRLKLRRNQNIPLLLPLLVERILPCCASLLMGWLVLKLPLFSKLVWLCDGREVLYWIRTIRGFVLVRTTGLCIRGIRTKL